MINHLFSIFLLTLINQISSFKFTPTCITNNIAKISSRRLNLGVLNGKGDSVEVDVAVIGSGPAGTTISWLLQEREKLSVALIDPKVNSEGIWYPNYGAWRDEWHALSEILELPELKECTTCEWEKTDCFFGGSFGMPAEEKMRLDKAYIRVDRVKLQNLLRSKFSGKTVAAKLESKRISDNLFDKNLVHNKDGSELTLSDGTLVKCKILVDASGFESKLIKSEDPQLARGVNKPVEPGYQIAYGFQTTVDSLGPYQLDAMTLFDYRTCHFDNDPEWKEEAEKKPTFMYAMPMKKNEDGTFSVFWEETSLVGKNERRLSFEECKKRTYQRLSHFNINVLGVEEEEFCYIPMGGELPNQLQRIIAFGGAANLVHPATGYHACRMLAASSDVARIIGEGVKNEEKPDKISRKVYKNMWSQQNRGQRDFQVYGGEFLMNQPVKNLRGFFSAFFSVTTEVWAGFLAGWPGLPGNENHERWDKRLSFALKMFLEMPNEVRLAMTLYAIKHTFQFGPNVLLRSITPDFLFGAGPLAPDWEKPSDIIGDMEAKEEAMKMIKSFVPSPYTPKPKPDPPTETQNPGENNEIPAIMKEIISEDINPVSVDLPVEVELEAITLEAEGGEENPVEPDFMKEDFKESLETNIQRDIEPDFKVEDTTSFETVEKDLEEPIEPINEPNLFEFESSASDELELDSDALINKVEIVIDGTKENINLEEPLEPVMETPNLFEVESDIEVQDKVTVEKPQKSFEISNTLLDLETEREVLGFDPVSVDLSTEVELEAITLKAEGGEENPVKPNFKKHVDNTGIPKSDETDEVEPMEPMGEPNLFEFESAASDALAFESDVLKDEKPDVVVAEVKDILPETPNEKEPLELVMETPDLFEVESFSNHKLEFKEDEKDENDSDKDHNGDNNTSSDDNTEDNNDDDDDNDESTD